MKWKRFTAAGLCAAMLAVPAGAAAAEAAPGPMEVWVNGETLDLSQAPAAPYEKEGQVMVPLWLTAQALGYTVTWEPERQGVRVENDQVAMDLTFGVDSYCRYSKTALGMTAPQKYGVGPEALEGRTYVPADMFQLLYCQVEREEQGVRVTVQENSQLPNPMVEYDYLFQAEYQVGFPVLVPTTLGETEMEHIYVIGGTMVQIDYANGACYRTAQGSQDISGDYQTYPDVEEWTAGSYAVTARGEKGAFSSAWWTDGSRSWSLTLAQPMDRQALTELVSSLRQAN